VRQPVGRHAARILAVLLVVAAVQASAATEEVRSVATRKGVTQAFLLVRSPKTPAASVILFAGGDGHLALSPPNEIGQLKTNFLVKMRERFANAGFLVAVIDTPSDRGDYWNFRTSKEHAEDVKQVIAALREMAPVPVWLVGTSMGSVSAAGVAGRLAEGTAGPDGLVLTSSIVQTSRNTGETVKTAKLGDIRIPTLIVRHKDDACKFSSPGEAPSLYKALAQANPKELLTFEGGNPPKPDPCETQAPHGYFGIERDVVDAIIQWIKAPHAG
jgi:predicted alpha/beta-hydrolase family hydrolase